MSKPVGPVEEQYKTPSKSGINIMLIIVSEYENLQVSIL
jgi:hypothetical protein